MSFIPPNTFEDALSLADDICAIAYALYHDKDLVVGLWGYHDKEYRIRIGDTRMIPPPPNTREIVFEGYYGVLSDDARTDCTLLYGSTMKGVYDSCILSYHLSEDKVKVRNSKVTGNGEQITLPDMTYLPIMELHEWSEEYYFQQSLVQTYWELQSFLLMSTLRHEKILSLRVDIGHMCAIIQESSKEKLDAVRKFYAQRDRSLSSPLFDTNGVMKPWDML